MKFSVSIPNGKTTFAGSDSYYMKVPTNIAHALYILKVLHLKKNITFSVSNNTLNIV